MLYIVTLHCTVNHYGLGLEEGHQAPHMLYNVQGDRWILAPEKNKLTAFTGVSTLQGSAAHSLKFLKPGVSAT